MKPTAWLAVFLLLALGKFSLWWWIKVTGAAILAAAVMVVVVWIMGGKNDPG